MTISRGNLKIAGAAALVVAGGLAAWRMLAPEAPAPGGDGGAAMVEVRLPDRLGPQAAKGRSSFEARCASCHGLNAAGREGLAPPLVHKIYEPGHHGDMSFLVAAMNGVRAHHWPFGDMPPVEGITPGEMADIVTYVRALQRENGIF